MQKREAIQQPTTQRNTVQRNCATCDTPYKSSQCLSFGSYSSCDTTHSFCEKGFPDSFLMRSSVRILLRKALIRKESGNTFSQSARGHSRCCPTLAGRPQLTLNNSSCLQKLPHRLASVEAPQQKAEAPPWQAAQTLPCLPWRRKMTLALTLQVGPNQL